MNHSTQSVPNPPWGGPHPRPGRVLSILVTGVALVAASTGFLAHAADVDNMYNVSLSTTGQSVWGPGTSAAPNGGVMNIVNVTWPETGEFASDSFDAIGSFVVPDLCVDLTDTCKAGCDTAWGLCRAACFTIPCCANVCQDADSCKNCRSDCDGFRSSCKSDCDSSDLKGCVSDLFPEIVGSTWSFGAKGTVKTKGNLGLQFNTSDMVRTLDVDYTGDASIISPSANSFLPGETLVLDTSFLADSAAELISPVPTGGSLFLDGVYGIFGEADVEICFIDCTTLFVQIDTFNGGPAPVDHILELLSSTMTCLSGWPETGDPDAGSICALASTPAWEIFSMLSGISGYFQLPAVIVTSVRDVLNQNKLIATGEDEFMALSLDLDAWITFFVPPLPDFEQSISWGEAFIGVNFLDWDFRVRTFLNHLFEFDPTVKLTMTFSQAVDYRILDSGGSPISAIMNGTTAVLYAGQKVELGGPPTPTDVEPKFEIKDAANFSNETETHVEFSTALRILFAGATVPAFTIVEADTLCILGACLEAIEFGGFDLGTLGPLFQKEWTLATLVDTDDFDGDEPAWSLEGFNSQTGASFVLDPQEPPVVNADTDPVTVDEGDLAENTGTVTDPEGDTVALSVSPIGTVINNNNETWDWSYQTTDGPANGTTVTVTGDDGNLGTDTAVFDLVVNNVVPDVSASPSSQSVQYSDTIETIMISAEDVAADTLTAATIYSFDGGPSTNGLPTGLTLNIGPCTPSGVFHTCEWTITGEALVPEGTYDIEITITDKDGGAAAQTVTLNAFAEDAVMAFDGSNPPVVQVETDGGDSPPFTLTVHVKELLPDGVLGNSLAEPGDIGEAVVEMSLVPIGPGGTETVLCTPVNDPAAFDYNGVLTVECAFDDVKVNTYSVEATLIAGAGGLFYTGFADDVLTIFDPSLGFTTGGGHFAWLGDDMKTNFGFTVQYGRRRGSAKGSLLVIKRVGPGMKYRIKSNAMAGLAVGDETDFGWASFTGKCTFQDPSMADPEGNHSFVAYVEDHGEPGTGVDRIWLQVFDKNDNLIAGFSLPDTAVSNAETLNGGNIVVPHTTSGK